MIGCTRYEHAFGSAALQPTASDFFCPNQDSKKICCQKRDAPAMPLACVSLCATRSVSTFHTRFHVLLGVGGSYIHSHLASRV